MDNEKIVHEGLDYLKSFEWVDSLDRYRVDFCLPGVVALLSVEISAVSNEVDRELWVVSGDLPDAYFVKDQAKTASRALAVYCDLMEAWVECVRSNGDFSQVYPVEAQPSAANAEMLESRINFIRSEVIPSIAP
ncbi:hypothetical protein [Erythrobacter ani]|uniref:Uncharacterized protein n=1 Tax=Erythrobacter ani TaxID=2827235 RepID=A0ABS6SJL4_9SPHN|nr:hypothetical protein [Erythrobacter ani]MBV7265152.1 hypothetical protein [Erythrobacter ani]